MRASKYLLCAVGIDGQIYSSAIHPLVRYRQEGKFNSVNDLISTGEKVIDLVSDVN